MCGSGVKDSSYHRPAAAARNLINDDDCGPYLCFSPAAAGLCFCCLGPVSPPPGPSWYSDLQPVRSSRSHRVRGHGDSSVTVINLPTLGSMSNHPHHTTLYLEILWLQTCKLDTAVDTLIAIYTSNYPVLDSNYPRDMDKVQLGGAGPWL